MSLKKVVDVVKISLDGYLFSEQLSKANQDSVSVVKNNINFIDMSEKQVPGFVIYLI